VLLTMTSPFFLLQYCFSSKWPLRKRGGRTSWLVDRDLTGQLSDVIFSFSFLLLDQWKEGQIGNASAPLHSVLVEI
jgi:hypothetical protein